MTSFPEESDDLPRHLQFYVVNIRSYVRGNGIFLKILKLQKFLFGTVYRNQVTSAYSSN